jgi:Ca2+:H+ antiporter
MYAVSGVLPLAYIIGLIFTLKTHAYIYEPKEGEENEEHDSPEWGKIRSAVTLLIATGIFAIVSDELTESIEGTVASLPLTKAFLGVFFIGAFGNAAELLNAVNFGLKNNIALSLEIGAAGTIQTALIQIPGLVFFSAIFNHLDPRNSFILIFPSLHVFAILFSVIIVNYISADGKSNYFEGSALVLVYILMMVAFFFVPNSS